MRASEIAERALLGALLLEPARVADVSQWLETADFYAHRHALVYSTTLDVRRAEEVPTPRAVLDRIMPDPESRRNVDGPFLHTLMESCPHPDRAVVYGRMVLEASIHRRTAERATRLEYVARSESPADVMFDQLDRELTSWAAEIPVLQAKWTTAGGEDHGVDVLDVPPTVQESVPGADAAEVSVVASLLSSPWQYESIKDWLRPEDFSRRSMADTYAAIVDVASRGVPIDHVTVMWGVMRAGAITTDLDHEAIARLARAGVPGYAAVAARDVLRASLCRTTSRTARQLGAVASLPTVSPTAMLSVARRNVEQVGQAGRRWLTSGPRS